MIGRVFLLGYEDIGIAISELNLLIIEMVLDIWTEKKLTTE